jgi:ABC-type branched-subunit amino acid transport system substrate-binding protein
MIKHVSHWPSALLFTLLAGLSAALPAAASPAAPGNTIVLGQSAPLTGPSSLIGIEMRDGALAYFEHVNKNGGVNGRKIVLKTLDDGADALKTAINTRQLIETDGAFALFGYVGIGPSKAAMPMVEKEDLPFFAALTGGEFLHAKFRPNVFNIRAGNAEEGEKIAENLEGMGLKKVAVLYNDDVAGKAAFDEFDRAMKKRKMTVTGTATIPRNSTDVAAAAAKIRAMQVNVVLMITTYPASAAFIEAMRKGTVGAPFFWNMSFVGSQGLAKALGDGAAGVMISQVMPSPWNDRLALIKEYKKIYLTTPDRKPGFSSLEGFIAAKAFVKGLERAGSHLTRASFTAALESGQSLDLGGFSLKFSPSNHEASNYVELTVIRNDGTFMY